MSESTGPVMRFRLPNFNLQGAELDSHSEFGVLVPAGLDDLEVRWLEREVVAQLFGIGITVVLAVSAEVVAGGLVCFAGHGSIMT
jgi:hypothetical protein